MRWSLSHKKTTLLVLCLCVIVFVGSLIFRAIRIKPTYLKIVDKESLFRDNSASPGADIRGAALIRANKEPRYIAEVITFLPKSLNDSAHNTFTDASVVVGDLTTKKNAPHLALSPGGELIIRIDAPYKTHDTVIVYEIGQTQGRTAEYYEVSIAKSADGPWTLLGTGAGESRFTIP